MIEKFRILGAGFILGMMAAAFLVQWANKPGKGLPKMKNPPPCPPPIPHGNFYVKNTTSAIQKKDVLPPPPLKKK